MTVKELITSLLDEEPNAKVSVEICEHGKTTNCLFDIKEIKHWGHQVQIIIEDWRVDENEKDLF